MAGTTASRVLVVASLVLAAGPTVARCVLSEGEAPAGRVGKTLLSGSGVVGRRVRSEALGG